MIAQQDYLHFKQSMPIAVNYDCELIAFLLTCWDRKTIWDAIIETGGEGEEVFGRVTEFSRLNTEIVFGSNSVEYVIGYTPQNYEGLAAIQKALLAAGESVESIPPLTDEGNAVGISGTSYLLTTPDGYPYVPTMGEDDELVALAVGTTLLTENALAISEEDAQKLIGLPLV